MTTQILVFALGNTKYCVDIDTINEIVEKGSLTEIPNEASHVRGVMDLRGDTTTIIDPKQVLDIDGETVADRVVIFETGETRPVGWLVDQVHEVVDVSEDDIETVSEEEAVRGVIRSFDRFVIWLEPAPINSANKRIAVPN